MNKQTEALKMAIAFMETLTIDVGIKTWNEKHRKEAINACKEALEQPQCNPHPKAPHGFCRDASHSAGRYVCECEGWEVLNSQEQEPVAWMHETYTDGQKLLEVWCDTQEHKADDTITIPLYTHPAQPLSDWDIDRIAHENFTWEFSSEELKQFARAIEKAHGIV